MKKADYEELLKKGYTEEEIKVAFDAFSNIDISDKPLGPGRLDKGVFATDSNGKSVKTSSIMMGYNKSGIVLENGEYASFEEFKKALQENLKSDDQNVVYVCKSRGKNIEPSELVTELYERAMEAHSSLELSDDWKVQNQDSKKIAINESTKHKKHNKGILMLGNQGIRLSNGDFVLIKEIEAALSDYVKMKPKPIQPISPVPVPGAIPPVPFPGEIEHTPKSEESEKNDEKYIVIKRFVKKMSWVPAAVAAAVIFLNGFGMQKQLIDRVTDIQRTQATYSMSQKLSEDDIKQIYEEARNEVNDVSIGELLGVKAGISYHESSDYQYGGKNAVGVFGGQSRKEGNYTVDGISILADNKIVSVKYEKGQTLGEVLEETAKKLGIDVNKLIPMIHLGGPVSGWVNALDLYKFNGDDLKNQSIRAHLDQSEAYNGVINDFKGNMVTINTEKGPVTINVKDSNGNLLESGAVVVGSDGEEYRIGKLSMETTKTREDVQVEGEKFCWSINNMSEELCLLAAASAIAGTLLSKRNRKGDKKGTPEFTKMTREEIRNLVDRARKEYKDASKFNDAAACLSGKGLSTYAQYLIDTSDLLGRDALMNSLINLDTTVKDIKGMRGK